MTTSFKMAPIQQTKTDNNIWRIPLFIQEKYMLIHTLFEYFKNQIH